MNSNTHPVKMVTDVVCGMELNLEEVRYAYEHGGTEYYFCSETCKDHFVDDPEAYVGE